MNKLSPLTIEEIREYDRLKCPCVVCKRDTDRRMVRMLVAAWEATEPVSPEFDEAYDAGWLHALAKVRATFGRTEERRTEMRTITETITCDECGQQTTNVYNADEQINVTSTIAVNYIGRPRDLCPVCMVKALRERADQIERGER